MSYLDDISRGQPAASASTSTATSTKPWSGSQPASGTSSRAFNSNQPGQRDFYENARRTEAPPVADVKPFTGPAKPVEYVQYDRMPAPVASTQVPPRHVIEAPPVGVTYEAYGDINEKAYLSRSTFPIKPDTLVALAKDAVFTRGLGMNDNGKCIADDFVFRGAHVETTRADFLRALQSFNLGESFRVKQQFFGWIVDPIQPNRVWFMNRQEAEQIKEFYGAMLGQKLILPPECLHVDFNEYGQVKEFGFYTVDRAQGNTGGLGGAFGYFYGVGKPLPFPEARPYKMSKRRRLFEFVGKVLSKIQTEWAKTTRKS
jgi:hypothetical protein